MSFLIAKHGLGVLPIMLGIFTKHEDNFKHENHLVEDSEDYFV